MLSYTYFGIPYLNYHPLVCYYGVALPCRYAFYPLFIIEDRKSRNLCQEAITPLTQSRLCPAVWY